jgi:hypothetical protein
MNQELSDKILDVYYNIKRQDKIRLHLLHLDTLLADIQDKIKDAEIEASKSVEDLDHSNAKIISNLLYKLIKKSEHPEIEKERHRFYLNALKINALIERRDLLLFEKEVLRKKRKSIIKLERELSRLLEEKEDLIIKENKQSKLTKDLIEIENEISYQISLSFEIHQAMKIGDSILFQLDSIKRQLTELNSYVSIGSYGQQTYTAHIKKMFVEQLKKSYNYIYHLLDQYNIELRDISTRLEQDFTKPVNAFEAFIDLLYNSFIFSSNVLKAKENLELLLSNLSTDIKKRNKLFLAESKKYEKNSLRMERKQELLLLIDLKRDNN